MIIGVIFMNIKEIAKILGKSEHTIRKGLQIGAYPFGTAFKLDGSNSYNYTLYPEKVREFIGGKQNEEISH